MASRWGSRRAGLHIALLFTLGLSLSAAPLPSATAGDAEAESKRLLKEARGRLADGDPHAALVILERALEFVPEDPEFLRVASEAAEGAEDKDKALWYARLGYMDAVRGDAKPSSAKDWLARIDALDPLTAEKRASIATYAESLLDLAELCVRRRLYANAVDFYTRVLGTPLSAKARKGLDKLYKSKRAIEALMRSGLDVPLRQKSRKSAKRIAREDKKHATWSSAWRLKGKNYTVITNMGWEVAETVSSTMEQANQFYRDMFQYKQGGGNTARCTIRLYSKHEDFVTHEKTDDDPTLLGFFQPGHNYVATFDHRDVGRRYGELWETLFHECLHQFTSMVLNQQIPGWLDEGLATYFEGTRLLANGRVEHNLAHRGWLESLQDVFKEGKPTFRDVISWFRPESFDATYYPVSYGLVYFFKNYENKQAERVYEDVFNAYLKTYRSGGKHDVVERFEQFFVKKAGQDGVSSLDEFQERWRAWIEKRIAIELGGPEQADILIGEGRRQAKHGNLDAAAATFRWALRKRPQDPVALLELARLHAARKDEDAAIYTYRQLRGVCKRAEDPEAELLGLDGVTAAELGDRCAKHVAAIDDYVFKAISEVDAGFANSLLDAADAYVEAAYPRSAVWLLHAGRDVLGGSVEVTGKLEAVKEKTNVTGARWRRLVPSDGMERWLGMKGWEAEDGVLVGTATDPVELYYRDAMPDSYRIEIEVKARSMNPEGYFGIAFGVDDSYVLDIFGVSADQSSDLCRLTDDWGFLKSFSGLSHAVTEPFKMGIEVDHGVVTFLLGEKRMGRYAYPASEMRGRVGFFLQDAAVEIRKIRVAW